MSNGWGDGERSGRVAGLLALAGGTTAVVSLVLAGATGEPYLAADGVNGWLVVFAAGLLAALVSRSRSGSSYACASATRTATAVGRSRC